MAEDVSALFVAAQVASGNYKSASEKAKWAYEAYQDAMRKRDEARVEASKASRSLLDAAGFEPIYE